MKVENITQPEEVKPVEPLDIVDSIEPVNEVVGEVTETSEEPTKIPTVLRTAVDKAKAQGELMVLNAMAMSKTLVERAEKAEAAKKVAYEADKEIIEKAKAKTITKAKAKRLRKEEKYKLNEVKRLKQITQNKTIPTISKEALTAKEEKAVNKQAAKTFIQQMRDQKVKELTEQRKQLKARAVEILHKQDPEKAENPTAISKMCRTLLQQDKRNANKIRMQNAIAARNNHAEKLEANQKKRSSRKQKLYDEMNAKALENSNRRAAKNIRRSERLLAIEQATKEKQYENFQRFIEAQKKRAAKKLAKTQQYSNKPVWTVLSGTKNPILKSQIEKLKSAQNKAA